jgi:predicted aldo/keto reductase-like oxidoreductase
VWNDAGVSLLLSGMSTMEQVEQNLAAADRAEIGVMSKSELERFEKVRAVLKRRTRADCTACRYCQPCPAGVEIPRVLSALNSAATWDDANAWAAGYVRIEGKASLCTACGQCEDLCPQGLPVRGLLKEAVGLFGS